MKALELANHLRITADMYVYQDGANKGEIDSSRMVLRCGSRATLSTYLAATGLEPEGNKLILGAGGAYVAVVTVEALNKATAKVEFKVEEATAKKVSKKKATPTGPVPVEPDEDEDEEDAEDGEGDAAN